MLRIAFPNYRYRFRLACDRCGVKLRITKIFCPFCGTRLWPAALMIVIFAAGLCALVIGTLAVI